ncbi:hypothetical protein [Anaerobacillus alkalilacustris]|uniref:hypothetical protein n=1 Tax=Anaerobacillus alkalilacustris TaxID=393763 RepID=UPI0011136217|nr:hypothetical protein [Anaerobacillus alkalilacustris]
MNDVKIDKEWLRDEDGYTQSFKFAAIEDRLDFEIPVAYEALYEMTITLLPKRTPSEDLSIFLISDSTVKTYDLDQSPMAGWGQVIHRFFFRDCG